MVQEFSAALIMPGITPCRSCRGQDLVPVLDIGTVPLANALLDASSLDRLEPRYPLHLLWCPRCSLLQIGENVPAEILFAHYFYLSSFSDAFLKHCEMLAARLVTERNLDQTSLVIDIASNDGYLLQFYQKQGIPVLGIEPAENIVRIAEEKGVPTRHIFFREAEAQKIVAEGLRADVIHAHNVMPHVADQRDFAAGIAALLKTEGIAVIEFAYAIDTIDRTEFDQIYHEHMCYFSLTAFKNLCTRFGLDVIRVERLSVHGGSLRVFLAHKGAANPDNSVPELLDQEKIWGVDTVTPYAQFAERAATLKTELMALLKDLKTQGKRIAAYGASAKGSTLMQYCGIDATLVDYVVDRSTVKQGHYTPGNHLKIEPVEKLLENQPDYVLLLTWNFADEILAQQKEYRARGGKFIVPVPKAKVL